MINRIIFAGNNQIAVDILKFLVTQNVKIVGLIIHPKNFQKRARVGQFMPIT